MYNIYLYILIMGATTYLIRMLPFTLFRKEIKNMTFRSFLYYVPYVTLAVMTFPAILTATSSIWSGLAGFTTAAVLAYQGKNLFQVSIGACVVVFLAELMI